MVTKALHEAERSQIRQLEQITNVGSATADDLRSIGISNPQQLVGQDPWVLYVRLCHTSHVLQDPCVLDGFMSVVEFMNGQPPKKWWEFTNERKTRYAKSFERFSLEIDCVEN